MKRFNKEGGFTLIEMLIVFGFIILLMAFIISRYLSGGAADKLATKVGQDMVTMKDGITLYTAHTGCGATGLDMLWDKTKAPATCQGAWRGPYVQPPESGSYKSPWGEAYTYVSLDIAGSTYHALRLTAVPYDDIVGVDKAMNGGDGGTAGTIRGGSSGTSGFSSPSGYICLLLGTK